MRTAIATVICCNNCQRRHTNSRCHTDNCRRADSASSHATSGSSSRGCAGSGRCGASSTRRCLGPVCCFRAANAAGVVNMKAIRIAESLCFITFPLFIAWTIRTLEIRLSTLSITSLEISLSSYRLHYILRVGKAQREI